eukprot:gnl/MRDRNA2_/MRDRNA2_28345_c0_seq1.p1 gnl/MRDRNA2_/MRDRNA2_28345_c0~~gnl/MRDRNA2_/MRDRNA2_28345_c0_seq1.p1  ORF type:complete len:2680 (+),score=576.91 gnl/MRDRNA2_/MRDRNA2_28345_c0_seq1:800-8041(+)
MSSAKEICVELCAHQAEVNARNVDGATPLHLAVQAATAECLVRLGADVSLETREQKTALHGAAERNDIEMAKRLLKMSANAQAKMSDGTEPQHLASKKGHLPILEVLLTADKTNCASVQTQDNDGHSSLWFAAESGSAAVCQRLVQAKSAIDLTDVKGLNALMIAAMNGHSSTVTCLLDLKASADEACKFGGRFTPLTLAAQRGHKEAVRALLEFKATVAKTDAEGKTSLYHANVLVAEVKSGKANKKEKTENTELGDPKLAIMQGLMSTQKSVGQRQSVGMGGVGIAAFKAIHLLHSRMSVAFLKDSSHSTSSKLHKLQNAMDLMELLHAAAGQELRMAVKDGEEPKIDILLGLGQGAGPNNVKRALVTSPTLDTVPEKSQGDKPASPMPSIAMPEPEAPTEESSSDTTDSMTFGKLKPAASMKKFGGQSKGWMALKKTVGDQSGSASSAVPDGLPEHCIDLEGKEGLTAMMICAEQGNTHVCNKLLDAKSDVNFRNSQGATPLLFAAWEGNLHIAELLVLRGRAFLNAQDNEKYTPLIAAADQGHEQMVHFLLAQKADVAPSLHSDSATALTCAVQRRHHEICKALVQAGADVNHRLKMNRTPFMVCCGQGDQSLDMAAMLLEHAADVNAVDAEGQTCLHYAAQAGALQLVQLSIQKGVDPQALSVHAKTALCLARAGAEQCHKDVVDLLSGDVHTMIKGAVARGDIMKLEELAEQQTNFNDLLDDEHRTAWMLAAQEGKSVVLKWLAKQGVMRSSCDVGGYTALHLAARHGHLEIVKFLLDDTAMSKGVKHSEAAIDLGLVEAQEKIVRRVPLERKAHNGYNVLACAIEGQHVSVVRYLIESGANIEHKTNDGMTMLLMALKFGESARDDLVTLFLQVSVNVNAASPTTGETPLMMAAALDCPEIMAALRKEGAGILDVDAQGMTAMSHAAVAGSLGAFHLLHQWGAPHEVKSHRGQTPLMFAAENDRLTFCKLLHECRASIAGVDSAGNTAVMLARSNMYTETEEFLVEWATQRALDAILHGQMETMTLLIPNDVDVDAPLDSTGKSALHFTAKLNDEKASKHLLNEGANVDLLDDQGYSPLVLGASHNAAGVIRLLLQAGCKQDVIGKDNETVLTFLSCYSQVGLVLQILKSANSDLVNVVNNSGFTALMTACKWGHTPIAKALVEHSAELHHKTPEGNTALFLAAEEGHGDLVQGLLRWRNSVVEIEAQLSWVNNIGSTVALTSAAQGHVDVIKVLLGFNPQLGIPKDSEGRGVGHFAAGAPPIKKEGVIKIFELLDAEAVHPPDQEGRTPLHYAAERGSDMVVEFLLSKNADPSCVDKDGNTVLMYAARKGHLSVISVLERAHSAVYLANKDGLNAKAIASEAGFKRAASAILSWMERSILKAVMSNNLKEFELLVVDEDLDPDTFANDKKQTLLHIACRQGFADMVQLCLKYDATIDAQDVEGNTGLMLLMASPIADAKNFGAVLDHLIGSHMPRGKTQRLVNLVRKDMRSALSLAAEKGDKECCNSLLGARALVDRRDLLGRSALFIAVSRGHEDVVTCLLQFNASPDLGDENDITPLMIACGDSNLTLCRQLLKISDPKAADIGNKTCVHHAAQKGNLQVVQYLLESQLDVDVLDADEKTPLSLAMLLENDNPYKEELVKVLIDAAIARMNHCVACWLQQDFEANPRDSLSPKEDGSCSLSLQIVKDDFPQEPEEGQEEKVLNVMRVFIPRDLNANTVLDETKMTPLIAAALGGSFRLCVHLLNAKAQVNLQDSFSITPLMMAAKYGHFDVVKIFNEHTADVAAVSANGNSALIFAAAGGHLPVCRLLRKPPHKWEDFKEATILETNNTGVAALHAARDGMRSQTEAWLENWVIMELREAAKTGNLKNIETLVPHQASADLTVRNIQNRFKKPMSNSNSPTHQAFMKAKSQDPTAGRPEDSNEGTQPPIRGESSWSVGERRASRVGLKGVDARQSRSWAKVKSAAQLVRAASSIRQVSESDGNEGIENFDEFRAEFSNVNAEVSKEQLTEEQLTEETRTPFMWAAAGNHLDAVKYLLKHKAAVNVSDNSPNGGRTPLMLSTENGHEQMVEYLISVKASPNVKNREHRTALMLAAKQGYDKLCKTLVDSDAILDAQDRLGRTALFWAAIEARNLPVVKALHSLGARCDSLDRHQQTVLAAARKRRDAGDGEKETATKKGAKVGWKEIIAFLEDWAHTVLSKAAADDELDVVKAFMPRDFPLDEPLTKDGRTVLLTAAQNGHLRICEFLDNVAGGDVDPINVSVKERKDHRTALMFAASKNDTQICTWLLSKGASVHDKDIHGQFPLMFVAENCKNMASIETARVLLNAKAAVGSKDRRLNTALHLAAAEGGLEMVTLLAEHGAALTVQNINGKTPAEVAAKAGHTDLGEYLGELALSGSLANVY